ncbi:MAG: hypothetical protein IJH82_06215 [Lachnospiraceae bacterium]|nr:hypothetical protein [Lachnospiraceae bacterium]
MKNDVKIVFNKDAIPDLVDQLDESVAAGKVSVPCPYCGFEFTIHSYHETCPECKKDFNVKFKI